MTVTVADNFEGGVMSLPRNATITIANKRGYSVTAVIYQKGDNYVGVSEMTIAEFNKIDDGAFAKISAGIVIMAVILAFCSHTLLFSEQEIHTLNDFKDAAVSGFTSHRGTVIVTLVSARAALNSSSV